MLECDRSAQCAGGLSQDPQAHEQSANARQYGTVRRLPKVQAPTLVIWGEHDEVNALEMGELTAELVPDSKLVVLKDTGHFAPTQRIDEFNNAVVEFL